VSDESPRQPGVFRRGGAFLVIGALAFVIDAAVFNLLTFGITGEGGFARLLRSHPPIEERIAALRAASA